MYYRYIKYIFNLFLDWLNLCKSVTPDFTTTVGLLEIFSSLEGYIWASDSKLNKYINKLKEEMISWRILLVLHIWDRQGKDPVFLKSRFFKIRMTESF